MGNPRKKYTKEFKFEAVKMVVEQGRSPREVAGNRLDARVCHTHAFRPVGAAEP